MAERSRLFRDAWSIARPYWFSEQRWNGRALLFVVVALNLALVYINVRINRWNNTFYNALQDKDYTVFVHQLTRFAWLAGFFILAAVYQLYVNQMLQIRWRRWLTDHYLGAWLRDRAYYRMQLTGSESDNPDQRIAEDIPLFIGGASGGTGTLGLAIGGMRAVVTLLSFVVILWGLSGPLAIPVDGRTITVPGYMVWVALVYAVGGTWLTNRIGRPLVRLNYDQQRYEADFRFGLARLRENTESVALYRGEGNELRRFRERFAAIARNWWDIMRRQKRLTSFTAGYAQAAVIFPILVAAPRYFQGDMSLGTLMQTALAFGQVQDALSFIVTSYPEVAAWRSVVARVAGFDAALRAVPVQTGRRIVHSTGEADSLTVDQVDLELPAGEPLIVGVTLALRRGDSALLSGPPGTGKSTLVRAIAGVWPFGRGEIRVPTAARILVLPQKPYLPIGTLREAVCYPTAPCRVDDRALRETLVAVGLPALIDRLDELGPWSLTLSPGEQQRIAFVRALIHRPDWLFLDEATSAVDEATEAGLYRLVRERLPHTGIFSVGHRSTLRALHGRHLAVERNDRSGAVIIERMEVAWRAS
jgi:vitamin B12/bleomycin/antimicrobial peptide transport system ATP-binding/permease protein